jgi:hypothetical protein
MKHLLLLLFLSPTLLSAQQSTLHGKVAVFNSQFDSGKRQYVAGATVEEDYGKSQATLTRADGGFDLALVGVRDRANVYFSVKKTGMEVVNADALRAVAGQRDTLRVFMAPTGKIAENKLRYYKINRATAEKSLTDKLAAVEKQLKSLQNDQARTKKLQTERDQLQARFEQLDELARNLSDRYAKINLDDASADYQKAFRFFQRGALDSALTLLQGMGLETKAAQIIEEQNRNIGLAEAYARRDAEKIRQKEDIYQSLHFKIGLLRSKFDDANVEKTYNLLMRMDSNDVRVVVDYAQYMGVWGDVSKAIGLFERLLGFDLHPSTRVMVLTSLSNHYDDPRKKEKAAQEAFILEEKACNNKPAADYCHAAVAIARKTRLIVQAQEGNFDSFERDMKQVLQALLPFKSEPNIYMHLQETARNLGTYYTKVKNYPEAKRYYQLSLEYVEAWGQNPPNFNWEEFKANGLYDLGRLCSTMGEKSQAIIKIEEAIHIYLQKSTAEQEKFTLQIAKMYEDLAIVSKSENDLKRLDAAYENSLKRFRKLAKESPNPYDLELARILNDWGFSYKERGVFKTAESLLTEGLLICEKYLDIPYGDQMHTRCLFNLSGVYSAVTITPIKNSEKIDMTTKNADLFGKYYKKQPGNEKVRAAYAVEWTKVSRLQLFERRYKDAEVSARKSLEISDRLPATALLSMALLFQGKYAEAERKCLYLKSQIDPDGTSWGTACTTLLQELEAAGITHPDVSKIRAILR